jgi:hypothetical protein
MLAVVGLWAARRWWDAPRAGYAVVYVLAMTGGLLTLYLFFPVPLAANIAWLWVWRAAADRRRALLRWLALQAAVLALVIPWVLYAAGGFLSTSSATPIGLLDFLHIYWTVLTVGIPVDVARFNPWTIPAALVFLAAVVALLAAAIRGCRAGGSRATGTLARDLTLLLAVLLLPAAVVYLISLPKQGFYAPPFNPRYLVIFAAFYAILLAWGLVTLGQWVALVGRGARQRTAGADGRARPGVGVLTPAVLGGFMVVVALVGLRPYYPGRVLLDDYKSLAATIASYRRAGDAIILYTDTDWPIFDYHLGRPWRGVPNQWDITPPVSADFTAPIWDASDGVWLVTTPYSAAADPDRHLPGWLESQAVAHRAFNYGEMALAFYARTPERAASIDALGPDAPTPEPLNIDLPSGSRLAGYTQAAHDFKSGDRIHLALYHDAAAPLTAEIGLIDASGATWQATPVELGAAGPRTAVDLLVSPDTPPGDYRFYVRDAAGSAAPFGRLALRAKDAPLLTAGDVTIANRVDEPFEQGIHLLGYDLAGSARPGESVALTLYWSADAPLTQSHKVFTHLLGDVFNAATGNFLWGQVDNEPAANTRPTTTWRSGEVIVDRYAIPVQPDAPPGNYRVEVGLYDPLTGVRLNVLDGAGAPAADHLILGTVRIEPIE